MKVTEIEYNGLILIVTGELIKEEPDNNINEGFEATDIETSNGINIWDEYDEEELQEIESICFDKVKEDNQTNWETVNA